MQKGAAVAVYDNLTPYFDREEPQKWVLRMIADHDTSERYGLHGAAVFACAPSGYLVVEVSGDSRWPEKGRTTQYVCATKADVDRILRGDSAELLQKCQDAGW